MGNVHSCVVASLSLFSVYLFYVHVYRAHRVLKSSVLHSDGLPSSAYLCVKYVLRASTRTPGRLYADAEKRHVVFTLLNCRLQTPVLRRFCSLAGYGWDYPDSEYRDVPLCFPEFLCSRLTLILLTDGNFRLSPAGLVRLRQTLKTLQPVDELKKGPFTLQVEVVEYRQVDAGVEVDVRLSAASRSGCLVWESVLTLLSKDRRLQPLQAGRRSQQDDGRPDEPEKVKQVELRVPGTSGLQCLCSFSVFSSLPRLPGSRAAPPLWMLSVCLAEIEKHRGVGVLTAPVSVRVQYRNRLTAPAEVTLRFWETSGGEEGSRPPRGFGFLMERHGASHLVGLISRSSPSG
ncbi:uncharacterized protein LOC115397987 [Salarias fasciatus]|uniref:uncharacterized protein LOC115397987 n=1 Tax=Salarias fasciatus TaxID=181472 RepID=UPI0011770116|nr:uncharacterized protein LOC115397987 [Salarias fasciatus]